MAGEIGTVPELSNQLIAIKNMEGETALSHAIQAQLGVLQVISNPKLCESTVDLMLESLSTAISIAVNDSQARMIQQKTAIMFNSMFFIMEAKILFEYESNKKENLELLKQGCSMLVDSASSIASLSGGGVALIINGAMLLENIKQNRDFFDKFIGFVANWLLGTGEDNHKKMLSAFHKFSKSTRSKLKKYRDLFGQSIVIDELIKRLPGPLSFG